jgi:sugar lactone lactonase YvrE
MHKSRLCPHPQDTTKLTFNSIYSPSFYIEQPLSLILINNNTKWKQNGSTIAGGHNGGDYSYQLYMPYGIYVDDVVESVYIADRINNRIVEWKFGAVKGQLVAGGYGPGNDTKQLNGPTDVTVDRKNNSLVICDSVNRRVVRWSRQNRTNRYIIISNIDCYGVTMDNIGDLYVSDTAKYEVRRWKEGDTNGTIVAGGNNDGHHLNQFNSPCFIFVDEHYSLYVSDLNNLRVMKWTKGAKEGIVVAGGKGMGDSLAEVYRPEGIVVDHWGNLYVADSYNQRIMRWLAGATEGSVVVGGNGIGDGPSQFFFPMDISFDRKGNLYVVDRANHRVQKFDIIVD